MTQCKTVPHMPGPFLDQPTEIPAEPHLRSRVRISLMDSLVWPSWYMASARLATAKEKAGARAMALV
jgi:hypothetical protein